MFNSRVTDLRDPRIGHAFLHALDRRALIRDYWGGQGRPSTRRSRTRTTWTRSGTPGTSTIPRRRYSYFRTRAGTPIRW